MLFRSMVAERRTRAHDKKVKKLACRIDIRKFNFRHRVVDFWNKLPEGVVDSISMDAFKRRF